MDDLITTTKAAEVLGVSQSRIRQLILEGKLPADKFGTVWMIRRTDLALVAVRSRGRPPGRKGGTR